MIMRGMATGKKTPASLYTHVVVTPNDGIRRTGKARVNVRMTRHNLRDDCKCKDCA